MLGVAIAGLLANIVAFFVLNGGSKENLNMRGAWLHVLGETLIKVLGDNHVQTDAFVEAYCPMEKAHWLQTGTTVSDPFGTSMATCGSIVSGKAAPSATSCPMGCGM